jgi:hypothetical protein
MRGIYMSARLSMHLLAPNPRYLGTQKAAPNIQHPTSNIQQPTPNSQHPNPQHPTPNTAAGAISELAQGNRHGQNRAAPPSTGCSGTRSLPVNVLASAIQAPSCFGPPASSILTPRNSLLIVEYCASHALARRATNRRGPSSAGPGRQHRVSCWLTFGLEGWRRPGHGHAWSVCRAACR